MPIGMTASGELVFPIQCKEILEREREKTVQQRPAVSEDNAVNTVIKPVESVPLPKRRQGATSSDEAYGCRYYRSYNPASQTYTDYEGRRRSCR